MTDSIITTNILENFLISILSHSCGKGRIHKLLMPNIVAMESYAFQGGEDEMNETQILEKQARSGGMTPAQAAEFVKNCNQFRTLREKMERYAGEGDLRSRLLAGLSLYHPEMQTDSLDRKVRMWLNSQMDVNLDRKTVFELAFILNLTTEQTDSFLALMTDEGFRWRDPDEIVLVYALNHGMDYPAAQELRKEMGPIKMTADMAQNNDENLTNLVREEIMNLTTKQELKTYLFENSAKFGKCRNRAWLLFKEYMQRLKEPTIDSGMQILYGDKEDKEGKKDKGDKKDKEEYLEEKTLSTFSVLRVYLHQEMIPRGTKRNEILNDQRITRTQKAMLSSILAAWPDEASLRKIEKRSMSVGRKTMILLFIALDEDPLEDEEDFETSEEEKRRERFESRYRRLNLMLVSCGYRQLDARNPFDWLILYAISVDDLFDCDNTLDELLSEVFAGMRK